MRKKSPQSIPVKTLIEGLNNVHMDDSAKYRQHLSGMILHASSEIEELIEGGLLKLLGITSGKNKVLQELSFKHQISILSEMGTGVDLSLLEQFKELRNEFAHGTGFNTLEAYYAVQCGHRETILKRVTETTEKLDVKATGTVEEKLYFGVMILIHEVTKVCLKLFEIHNQKTREILAGNLSEQVHRKGVIQFETEILENHSTIYNSDKTNYQRNEVLDILHKIHESVRRSLENTAHEELQNTVKEFNIQQEQSKSFRTNAFLDHTLLKKLQDQFGPPASSPTEDQV